MEQNESEVTWFQDAMKKGLILGAIHVFVFLLIYMFVPSKLSGFSYLFFIIGINIGYCIFQGNKWRSGLGGYIDFGAAFKHSFVLLVFNGIISTLIVPMVFSLVDSAYPEIMAQSQIDTSVYWASAFGAPEETLDQMKDQMDMDELKERYQPLGALTGFGIAAIFYLIGACIVGLFVRKRVPEVM